MDPSEVADQLQLSGTEAERVLEESIARAHPDNAGAPTVLESRYPDDLRMIRRFFLWLGASVIVPAAAEISTSKLLRYLTDENTGLDPIDRFIGIGHDLPERQIDFILRNRHERDWFNKFHQEYFNLTPDAKKLVEIIHAFDSAARVEGADVELLRQMLNYSKILHSKILLTNILANVLVRAGRGIEAKLHLEQMLTNIPDLPSQKDRFVAVLAEVWMNANYTTLQPHQYLDVEEWRFQQALALVNHTVGVPLRMKVAVRGDGRYVLERNPRLNEESVHGLLQSYGVPGFYVLAWSLLYFLADADSHEIDRIAGFNYKLCAAFRGKNLDRQVWNWAFISALHLYRMAHSGRYDKSVNERISHWRNKLLSIAIGDRDFWQTSRLAYVKDRITNRDPVPVCFAIWVNSTPELTHWSKSLDYPSGLLEGGDWQDTSPQRVRAAADLVSRKQQRSNISSDESYKVYGGGQPGLEIYTGPLPELMQRIRL